ncbi:ABC transporter substrate-binding protein [Paenibacillus sp. NAIST15-1]|uniref:ABC transporter substrate-binding protein n=1 Tax=Paenibacillus sp. NAIST15-1 TaxID=1605994 RepID=UPI00086C5DBC|nr:ABC transporter substrate-binding protein [Paenibacillus sp. NAIST15-1]GAV14695.1 ABC-type Fe3+-hydroxamate transport system, periplasmic component [Paenibacillus sp. NAIST15-1]
MITRHRMKILTCICTLLVMITAACSGQVPSNKQSESGKSLQVQTATSDTKPPADIAGADKRIAVLSIPFTSDLLALGITPIGAVTQKGKDFLPHVTDLLPHTQNLGNSQDPNLEALVNVEPDLIIAQEELIKGKDELEKIAPTIVLNFKQSTWQEQLQQLGKALGKEKEAEAFIADYKQKAATAKETIKQVLGDETVLVLRVMKKELRVYGLDRNYGSLLYQDLGIKPAKGLESIGRGKEGPQSISSELLPDFDPDHILLEVSADKAAQQLFKELEDSSIWKHLKAVKNGNVHAIEQQPWLDYSALGQLKSLDEAVNLFTHK